MVAFSVLVGVVSLGLAVLGGSLIGMLVLPRLAGRAAFDGTLVAALAMLGAFTLFLLVAGWRAVRAAFERLPAGYVDLRALPHADYRALQDGIADLRAFTAYGDPGPVLLRFAGLAALLLLLAWWAAAADRARWPLAVACALPAAVLGGRIALAVLRRRRFGVTVCHLLERAPRVGRSLQGEVRVECPHADPAAPPLPPGGVRIVLSCVAAGHVGGRSAWSSSALVPPERLIWTREHGLRVPVRIEIPDTVRGESAGMSWTLRLAASYSSIDYRAALNVPVLAPTPRPARDGGKSRRL